MTRALLIIDLQNGLEYDGKKLFERDRLLERVNQQILTYHQQQLPVIFVQHEDEELVFGSEKWHLFSQLDAEANDYYIRKTHANSFYQTELQQLLEQLKITSLEIFGAQTEYCVDTTIRVAHSLGYLCFMEKGGSTTLDSELLEASTIITHHEQIWNQRFLTFYEE